MHHHILLQPTTAEPEICNDSIDNDVDTLIHLYDADCNPLRLKGATIINHATTTI